jgi:hypothetical protein
MGNSIRDASLTTLKRKQRALAAYRLSFATAPFSTTYPGGFPNGNSVRPEQVRYQTGDVPVDARQGLKLVNCCGSATDDGYGKQAPATLNNHNQ